MTALNRWENGKSRTICNGDRRMHIGTVLTLCVPCVHNVPSLLPSLLWQCGWDLDLDNSRQEPEAITAMSGCALRKSGEPTLEVRYCVGLSN